MASRLSITDVLSLLNDSHYSHEDEEESDYEGEGVYSYLPEPAVDLEAANSPFVFSVGQDEDGTDACAQISEDEVPLGADTGKSALVGLRYEVRSSKN